MMKKLLTILGLAASLALTSGAIGTRVAMAQDKPAAEASKAEAPKADAPKADATKAEPAKVDAKAAAAKPAEAAPAKLPDPNKGDFTFMYVATILVILMTIPGLALFYGGLVRSKNMLSVLMQVFVTFCVLAVLWVVYGYSVAFTGGNPFFGGFSKVFLGGVDLAGAGATFSKGVYIPEMMFAMFQLTFAAITPALIIGAFAERMKFSAMLWFMVLCQSYPSRKNHGRASKSMNHCRQTQLSRGSGFGSH